MSDLYDCLDGGLLMVEELAKSMPDYGHSFSYLLLIKLAMEKAIDLHREIYPDADKSGNGFSFDRSSDRITMKYQEGGNE